MSDYRKIRHTPEEMADEFRKEYGDCLPKDFDYIAHLCFLRASYVC